MIDRIERFRFAIENLPINVRARVLAGRIHERESVPFRYEYVRRLKFQRLGIHFKSTNSFFASLLFFPIFCKIQDNMDIIRTLSVRYERDDDFSAHKKIKKQNKRGI